MSKKNKRDYYDVLGLGKNAGTDEIKRSFRKLAMKYHPDRNKEPGSKEKFQEAQEAYSVLSDADKRSKYDQYGFDAPNMGFGNMSGDGFSGFGDIFDMFFGGGGSGGGRGRRGGRGRARRQQYGEDIEKRVEINLKDVVSGVKKEIKFKRYIPCHKCDGTGGDGPNSATTCTRCNGVGQVEEVRSSLFGRIIQQTTCPSCKGEGTIIKNKCSECHGKKVIAESKKVTPTIPPGVETGNMLKVQGMGHIPSKNAIPGDLLLTVIVKRHPTIKRKGTTLYNKLDISIVQAVKGDKVHVETIDGNVSVKIPEGIQSGTEIRLKGKGLPELQRDRRGDHYVKVFVDIPSYQKLSSGAKKVMDELETFIKPISAKGKSGNKKKNRR